MERAGQRMKLNAQILEEASEWFVTFRDGQARAEERDGFTAWIRKSPEHVRAYLEISAIWADVRAVDGEKREFDIEELIARASGEENVVVLREVSRVSAEDAPAPAERRGRIEQAAPASTQKSSGGGRWSWLGSLEVVRWQRALAAAAVMLVFAVGGIAWWQLSRGTYATDVGEQRSLLLADGSMAELNSLSRIRVRFSDAERTVELLEGQALFRVAKDAQRPFVVESDSTRVRALGTVFDVYRRASGTTVTVLEGKVEVIAGDADAELQAATEVGRAHAASMPARVALGAGEQVVVNASQIDHAVRVNTAAATAWTQREIMFESASLAEVAEEFNRYNTRQLVVVEAEPGFHVSGVFSSTDPGSLVRFLRSRPGVIVEETEEEIRIRMDGH